MENTFSQIIRNARTARSLTLRQLSLSTGIDQGLLSHIESGKRKATLKQVNDLSTALGIPQKKLQVAFMAEMIYAEYGQDPLFLQGLQAAENRAHYKKIKPQSTSSDGLTSLLLTCDKLKSEWDGMHPLSNVQIKNLNEYFDISYTFESNRIEGNTLTLQETALVINKGLTIGGKSMREHLEAINHQHAIEFMRGIAGKREAISERLIKEIHGLVLHSIDNENAGRYRTINVRISGSEHNPPEFYSVPQEMEAFIRWFNRSKKTLHPVELAADTHHRLVSIHPFADGNGRTSRLLMNLILLRAGYPTVIIRGENETRHAYYEALEKAHTQSVTGPFREFIAEQTIRSVRDVVKSVKGK